MRLSEIIKEDYEDDWYDYPASVREKIQWFIEDSGHALKDVLRAVSDGVDEAVWLFDKALEFAKKKVKDPTNKAGKAERARQQAVRDREDQLEEMIRRSENEDLDKQVTFAIAKNTGTQHGHAGYEWARLDTWTVWKAKTTNRKAIVFRDWAFKKRWINIYDIVSQGKWQKWDNEFYDDEHPPEEVANFIKDCEHVILVGTQDVYYRFPDFTSWTYVSHPGLRFTFDGKLSRG